MKKKYCKVKDHCHYTGEYWGAAHSICNLKYSVSKQIIIVFHFIIKELEEKLKKQFSCLRKLFRKEFIKLSINMDMKIKNEEI